MKKLINLGIIFLVYLGMLVNTTSCREESEPSLLEEEEELSGGETTIFDTSVKAFDRPAANLSSENFDRFQVGNSFFRTSWVAAPSSTTARDGLGPTLNSISCTGCHINDGRGAPPTVQGDPFTSMLVRLSIPGKNANGGPLPDPNYGTQLQNRAISGVTAEGNVEIFYEEIGGEFADGESYSLRKPTYFFKNLQFGEMHEDIRMSPRTAPAMIGLGLLEAIPEEQILAYADPGDANQDGISGKPNYVWDIAAQKKNLGRFGWKANQPNLRQQSAGAFNGDLGLTSSLFPAENCTSSQLDCQQAFSGVNEGEQYEITDPMLDFVAAYSSSLGVPARRNWTDSRVLQGKKLFQEAKCDACHISKYTTRAIVGFPEFAGQTIRPYTDLLLHDMGEGLADNREDFEASGTEWRTPPLWGIGLLETVNGHTNLLHDGRARNFEEAILWHGGEAEASREAFKKMEKSDREALVQFLKSL